MAHLGFFFFSLSWGLTNLFFEIPGFSKALPSSCPKRGCLLLITTSSLCSADLHGTRLSTKIKTERPYFSQQQGVFQVGFTHMGGEGGGMSCSVLLSIQRQICKQFIYLLSPSPNLQSWEQEPSGLVISVSCL